MRKIDTVVVAARYAPGEGMLTKARAYERRGAVWTDWLIIDRSALLERLEAGKRVVTGVPRDLPGDFQVLSSVRREQRHGRVWIVSGQGTAAGDDLGLPLF